MNTTSLQLIIKQSGHHMMTSSNGNIFHVTGHLCGEFTGHRWIPRAKASDAEPWCTFGLHLNERLSKQSWGWWFETSLWRHRNDLLADISLTNNEFMVWTCNRITRWDAMGWIRCLYYVNFIGTSVNTGSEYGHFVILECILSDRQSDGTKLQTAHF